MKKIWTEIEEGELGEFKWAKKVELNLPITIGEKELDTLYVAEGLRLTAAFENKSTQSELLAEAQTERQIMRELIARSDNYELQIVEKEAK